jgi:hypothetical protein
LLEKSVERLRRESYDDLARRIDGDPETETAQGQSGTVYQLELLAMWDDQPGGNVRVLASVDDGGWRAFAPLTRSFIKAHDGTFVGE